MRHHRCARYPHATLANEPIAQHGRSDMSAQTPDRDVPDCGITNSNPDATMAAPDATNRPQPGSTIALFSAHLFRPHNSR